MMFKQKSVPMFNQNGSTTGMQPASTTTIIIPMIFGNHGVLRSYSLIDLELVVLDSQQIQSLSMIPSLWEYGMVAYLMEIPDPGYPFFSFFTKFL